MYWGNYKRFCGSIADVKWYKDFIEIDFQHNWINLAFITSGTTNSIIAWYRMED